MPTIDQTIEALRSIFSDDAEIKAKLKSNPSNPRYLDMEALIEKYIRNELESLLRVPPHMLRHSVILPKFHTDGPYEKSIFIMTKYPDAGGTGPDDKYLQKVIDVAENTIKACGYIPRIALKKPWYFPTLWDNVEMHLVGCSRGIAIVEDKYRPELNPNVALEWGCMRMMGKEVLYLREKTFSKDRADTMGFLSESFSWSEPEKEIPKAITEWLNGSAA
jgi:hypothetical protein